MTNQNSLMSPEMLYQLLIQTNPAELQQVLQQMQGEGLMGAYQQRPKAESLEPGQPPQPEARPPTSPSVDAMLEQMSTHEGLFPPEQPDIDLYEGTDDKQVMNELEQLYPERSIARSEMYADKGYEMPERDKMGLQSQENMGSLMGMAMKKEPRQEMKQMPGYVNKIIQGLMGGV